MTKEIFIETINNYQHFREAVERLAKAICGKNYLFALFESDWVLNADNIFDLFLKSHFTDDAIDLIYWYLFEDVDKIIYKENKEEIRLDSLDDLWNYLIENKESYFING